MVSQPMLLCGACLAVVISYIAYNRHAAHSRRLPERFVPVAPGVARLGYKWPATRYVEVHTYLITFGVDSILVDAGVPGPEYAAILASSLKQALGDSGKLRLILLTHGHIDHVGAIDSVTQHYPQAQVVFHVGEAPYLTGGASYNDIPADNPGYKIKDYPVASYLPASRVLHLTGTAGDVADALGPQGQAPQWQPQRGTIDFFHMPGHSPGQVIYLHTPSRMLLAGDVFNNLGSPPTLAFPPATFTPNMMAAREDFTRLQGLIFNTAFCSHDAMIGVPKLRLQHAKPAERA